MDLVTGAHVAVAVIVPLPRERMWKLITDVERLGEWSPEATGGTWYDGDGPYAGARFTAGSRYADGYGAEADPRALDRRLVTLCRNMMTTIAAMGAVR